jgi:hypothetical protein
MFPQETAAKTVKRADTCVVHQGNLSTQVCIVTRRFQASAQSLLYAALHLLCRCLSERNDQQLTDVAPRLGIADQKSAPFGQNRCLTRSRGRRDQDAASIGAHGLELLRRPVRP